MSTLGDLIRLGRWSWFSLTPNITTSLLLFQNLASFSPQALVSGCSTAGEISGRTISDQSLVGIVIKFTSSRVREVCCDISLVENAKNLGAELASKLLDKDLRGILVFSDGLHVNGSALIEAMNTYVDPEKIIISGGLAADGDRFRETWILSRGRMLTKHAIAIGLYGKDIKLSHGSRGGWDIFGPERTITKSHENVLYEIDGQPALKLYKNYLGERAKELPSSGLLFPFS